MSTAAVASMESGFARDADGNLVVASSGPGTLESGFLRDSQRRLLVSEDAAISYRSGGFARAADGSLVVTQQGPFTMESGFARDAAGRLGVSGLTESFQAPDALAPVYINPLLGANSNTNWSTVTQNSSIFNGGRLDSSGAQNASVTFNFEADAGTYALAVAFLSRTDGGIFTFAIDGVELDSKIDSYAPANVLARREITNITIPTSGDHTLTITLASKNATSTNYAGSISAIALAGA